MQESGGDGALGTAIHRLERALAQLETQAVAAVRQASHSGGGALDEDRASLLAELDAAHARERELQAAGAEAARALGRAIVEIRSALGDETVAAIMDEEA